MPAKIIIVQPNITPEENERRKKAFEDVLREIAKKMIMEENKKFT